VQRVTADRPTPQSSSRPDWLGDRRVSVVMPAMNEAECLPHVLPRMPAWIDEVLLVDGESTDATIDVARRLRPDVRIVAQQGRGKGAALRTGLLCANGDIIVTLDADGSTDPAEIPAFVGALLAGADFAKGSRFLQGGGSSDMTGLRRFGNWGFAVLANALFRTRFSDLTYGYNAVWAHNRWALALEIDGWPHEIITNIRVAQTGLRVVEVASFEHLRVAGTAKLRLFPAAVAILKSIFAEWLGYRQGRATKRPVITHVEPAD
jgi:glycosyltransferase involved in cell wall biosynthesis